MNSPDVVVIGGGIAGASVARELAASRSVLLLESEPELARHSTARSAATYIPGHGTDVMRALIVASGPRFAALAEELDAPPLLLPREVLWVAVDDAGERSLAAMLAERAGEPFAPVQISAEEAERRCRAIAPGAVRAAASTESAADVDTDALHQAYVRGLRARGGTVRTSAPTTSVTRRGDGWRVEAGGETVDTALVVDAAGAWADVVAGMAAVPRIGLVPHRRTIAMARVPDPARLRGPVRSPMVCEASDTFYFKAEADDLLLSPGDETPVEPGDARPDELDVALGLERVEAVTKLGLRSVRTSWAGLRSFVPDRRPVVGEWPEHPGFAFVAGQGGSGIETAPALSALAAAVLTGEPVPADIAVDAATLAPTRL
ncbi:FAD-binding oxidoreductase [Pseudonocardia sp.]|uniref:NAD(P)/FAD-dependent oxidoreductase n=1 Tax=Pseudonocardia sp. TaxID=60912 RepID=UPI002638E376|nr:FAD-dependent oxidoreductase [Pseudonocardia sp.]MCW2721730.1 dependent oxidoreductase [Pseudonocardia sp.]MDT7616822.1 D-arginine dehydrogenase [Pseudonocardiales bacterium]